ncbi:magnesium transporter [Saccharicrinis carchari]|uniref:Magnesium transporter MgtE n=1 Tax=Saccharicrinis carchari TaxID=1168039 RepID=A0A521CG72_SACCC|nr:magnesium transporter [Saccharicrinis carchari]SMO58428.1 magnesium transporter [Saccharicrinis carchari]
MDNNTAAIKKHLVKEYFLHFPMEAARVMNSFPTDKILHYLEIMPVDTIVPVFCKMNPEIAAVAAKTMDQKLFKKVFTKVDTPLAARLLSRLNKEDVKKRLKWLPPVKAREIEDFLTYGPDTAGYIMETGVIVFHPDNVVQDVLDRIRKLGDDRIRSIYIIDDDGYLLGKIPIQTIAISQPGDTLRHLYIDAPRVNAMDDREDALEIMEKENLLQVPVTDINNKLLGIIKNDALMSAVKMESTENVQAMFGAGREERALSKVSYAVKKRLPWLQVNLATAFIASMVVGVFEDTIAQITILAIFLPVVAGQSGNTGSQALAVTMRGLALREIRISQWFVVARKELFVGFINGVAVALTTGTIVFFWSSSAGIAIVIAISMVLSMMVAGFSGAGIPMALKAIGQDPATSSSILLTTVTDITGFFSFLGLATVLMSVLGIAS